METQLKSEEELNDKILNLVVSRGVNGVTAKEAKELLGVSEGLIMRRFLLKPSLIPTVSIVGLDFAAGLGNAFLVELIFNWPGLSRYGMNAMLSKDLNAISAVILVFGVAFVVVNICVDILVAQLDPRIRMSAAKGE